MGTRSAIKIISEGKEYPIYSQFDGYLEGVGQTLVNDLISTGLWKKLKKRLKTGIPVTDEIIKEGIKKTEFYILNLENLSQEGIDLLNTNSEQLDNVEDTFRFYDRGDTAIVTLSFGEGNFIFLKELKGEEARIWIEFEYVLDLDNEIFEEKTCNISINFNEIDSFEDIIKYEEVKNALSDDGIEYVKDVFSIENFKSEDFKEKFKALLIAHS